MKFQLEPTHIVHEPGWTKARPQKNEEPPEKNQVVLDESIEIAGGCVDQ